MSLEGEVLPPSIINSEVSKGIPRNALLVICFEFCERLAFYSTLSLFALFLTASRSVGGFEWDRSSALIVVGIFTGLMYAMPVVGGTLADHLIGHRRSIAIGAIFLLTGYLILAIVPSIIISGIDFGNIFARVLKFHTRMPAIVQWSTARGFKALTPNDFTLTVFWIAISLLATGNALVKSTLVVVLGDSFKGNDRRREAGYAFYYMSINIGGLFSGLISGSILAALGWQYVFFVPVTALAIGLLIYVLVNDAPANNHQCNTVVRVTEIATVPVSNEWSSQRVLVIVTFACLLFVYSVGSFQLWGTISLFIDREVDRRLGSLTIPTEWFTSVNAAGLILCAPLFALLWRTLALLGKEPSVVGKYILALVLGGTSLLIFAWIAWPSNRAIKDGIFITTTAIAIQAAGEVAAWTSTYGLIYKIAPRRHVAAVMGTYYAATLGLGSYVAALLGRFERPLGAHLYFLGLGSMTFITAIIALALYRMLNRAAIQCGVNLRP